MQYNLAINTSPSLVGFPEAVAIVVQPKHRAANTFPLASLKIAMTHVKAFLRLQLID